MGCVCCDCPLVVFPGDYLGAFLFYFLGRGIGYDWFLTMVYLIGGSIEKRCYESKWMEWMETSSPYYLRPYLRFRMTLLRLPTTTNPSSSYEQKKTKQKMKRRIPLSFSSQAIVLPLFHAKIKNQNRSLPFVAYR